MAALARARRRDVSINALLGVYVCTLPLVKKIRSELCQRSRALCCLVMRGADCVLAAFHRLYNHNDKVSSSRVRVVAVSCAYVRTRARMPMPCEYRCVPCKRVRYKNKRGLLLAVLSSNMFCS